MIKFLFITLILILIFFPKEKELKFIHITKTGGTSIENTGIDNNIEWGKFDKRYGWWHRTNEIKDIIKHPHMLFYDYFLVCRNPYDRIISEFHCKWGGVGNKIKKYNIKSFNKYITRKILNVNKSKGHYIEQYKYIPPFFIKCNILKFENLNNDFNKLMKIKNINIILKNYDNITRVKKFTVNDISKKNIMLINKVYSKDFEIFKYDKILV